MARWNGTVWLCSCALLSTLGIVAGATTGLSQVDSADSGLLAKVRKVQQFVESSSFNSDTCPSFLKGVVEEMNNLEPARMGQGFLYLDAPSVIETMFKTRLAIHQRMSSLSPECLREAGRFFLAYRFTEELLAEWRFGVKHLKPEKVDFEKGPRSIWDFSGFPYFHLAPGSDGAVPFRFRNGDVMITRGSGFFGATISSLTEVPSAFSHVAMVHVDEKTGTPESLEAFDITGAVNFNMDEALKNDKIRILILRPKDPELGSRAADLAYLKLKTAKDGGKPIPYDFDLKFDEHSRLTCNEIARMAYDEVSSGRVIIPEHPGQVHVSDRKLLSDLGAWEGDFFAPGDLEFDSRFNIVGEFRDLRITRDLRQKQIVLSKIFEWIEDRDYRTGSTAGVKLAKNVAWPIRKTPIWPLFRRLIGVSEFAKEVPKRLIGAMALINQIGKILMEEIQEQDELHLKKTGWSMTQKQMGELLEQIRAQDLEAYRQSLAGKRAKPKFHKGLHPEVTAVR